MVLEYSWKAFEFTGDIESYLLFKELQQYEECTAISDVELAIEEVAISS